jgi:ribokinase
MTELNTSQLISALSVSYDVPYPVILPDFFVDHFVLVPTLDEFVENLKALAKQGGGNLLGNEQFIRRGGNSVNTVSALLSLDIDAKLIATTDEYGKSLLKALAPDGLDLRHVHTDGRLSSTVSIETAFDGRKVNLMISDSGSASSFKFSDLTPMDLELIKKSGLVALVNLNHNKDGASLAQDLFRMVRDSTNAITFMDIGDPSSNPSYIEPLVKMGVFGGNLDILGLNENEVGWLAWVLSGHDGRWKKISEQPKEWIHGARLISEETGVRVVLHTPHFTSTFHEGEIISIPSFQVEPKVTCGSGDAFNAGLIYGLLNGLEPIDQLVLANAIASLYISSVDSNPPNQAEVIRFLKSEPLLSAYGKKLLMD